MKIIEKKPNQIVFTIEMEETLANSIRRYVNQIPVVAIDEVEISRNDSPLYDETVAHRMGLLPLKNKALTQKKPKKLKLKVNKEGVVYSEEIKGDPEVVYKKIPITTLDKGQELEIIATPKVGKGSEHSKFTPGLMFYRNVVEVTVDKNLYNEIKKACPNSEIKDKGQKITIIDDKKQEIADVCEGICKRNGKKAEIDYKDKLVITLESFGQTSVEDIFKKSIEILKKDLTSISKKITKA
jgi:DNA-directed RNA polymerase subunit D